MKTFKLLDIIVSIGLIMTFTALSLVQLDGTFIIGYLVVGAWQVISMLIHTWNGWFCRKGSVRYNYHMLVIIIISGALLGLALNFLLMIILYILLFAAPAMAIFYCLICYEEITKKMQRPLSLLK